MQCRVCGKEFDRSPCPNCGYDASGDRAHFPTLWNDGKVLASPGRPGERPVSEDAVPQPVPEVKSRWNRPFNLLLILAVVIAALFLPRLLRAETASPAQAETASPLVAETASPVVAETASPVVAETASPVVEETASPVVEETASPVVAETASSAMAEAKLTAAVSQNLPSDSRLFFSSASASSEFVEDNVVYSASNVIQEKSAYPWAEGVKGWGNGETLSLYFDSSKTVSALSVRLGFAQTEELFERNNRPSKLRFSFSDGSSVECSFQDLNQQFYVHLSRPVQTRYVQITVLAVYSGTDDDTCIATVQAYGY